jgi:hypothetical protein
LFSFREEKIVELIVLQEDTIDLLSERTGRSTEKLIEELFMSRENDTQVHYYFGLPDVSRLKHGL